MLNVSDFSVSNWSSMRLFSLLDSAADTREHNRNPRRTARGFTERKVAMVMKKILSLIDKF